MVRQPKCCKGLTENLHMMLVEMRKLQSLSRGCFYGMAVSMRSKKTIVLK